VPLLVYFWPGEGADMTDHPMTSPKELGKLLKAMKAAGIKLDVTTFNKRDGDVSGMDIGVEHPVVAVNSDVEASDIEQCTMG
jgi:hypothetical protein